MQYGKSLQVVCDITQTTAESIIWNRLAEYNNYQIHRHILP